MVDINILRQTLTTEQVLEPGSAEYEEAVFIGNLSYRFTTPAFVIRAKSTNDVVSTIDFARLNGIRLTVKNGGHSYMGYCLNNGGIVLDLSLMNTCHIDYDKMLIRMDGGLVWKDVYYKYLKDNRNIVIGGQCPTVGVSGFTLGAGLSPFFRSYGLGCDNLLEMTIVTWDGQVVTVSREDKDAEKRELFWALAGGGGGNFGVTVSLTSRMHKLRDQEGKVVCGQLKWNLPQQKDAFEKMMNAFNTNKCPPELTVDALWTHTKNKQLIGGMTVIYNGRMEEALEVLKPLLVFGPDHNDLKEMQWTDWVHQSEGWDPKSKVYHHHTSFIFAEGAITPELTSKISSLVEEAARVVGITDSNAANDPKCHFLWDHIGAETEQIASDGTPFPWRKGHYVSNIKVQWTDQAKKKDIMKFVRKCQAELLPYAIDGKAAYINYIDATVNNWQEAYYGKNYQRLQRVKQRWDPKNFFWNWQSIEPLPLESGDDEALPPNGVIIGPDNDDLPRTKVEKWWKECAPLVTPGDLKSLKTDQEVFERGVFLRKHAMENMFQ
ncbi:FAD-binding domain-containing protein [Colletotrichum falcatum]|nr:FAD-binding domain-containing protein [Colletotrichum falcatum]